MKNCIPGLVFWLSIFCTSTLVDAQSTDDLAFAQQLLSAPKKHQVVTVKPNPGFSMLRPPYLFYKYFISSQDGHSCSFYPSCANFALESVSAHGLFPGILLTFDRLTRCNGLNAEDYEWHAETGRLYDPSVIRQHRH